MPVPPYMKLWVSDFLLDPLVAALSPEERGIYLLLLVAMWANGGWLPADDKLIARKLGMDVRRWRQTYKQQMLPMMSEMSDTFRGRYVTQKRLASELEKAVDLIAIRTANLPASRRRKPSKAEKRPPKPEREFLDQHAYPNRMPMQQAKPLDHVEDNTIAREEKGSALQAENPSQAQASQDSGSHPHEDDAIKAVRSDLTKRLVADGLKGKSLSDIANMGKR